MQLTEKQETYRKTDPVKIARTFRQSTVIKLAAGAHQENPDYHPPIFQTEDGRYLTGAGLELDPDQVPEYILSMGPPPELTPESEKKQLDMRQAMLEAGVPDTDPNTQLQRAVEANQKLHQENESLKASQAKILDRLAALESAPAPAPVPVKRGPGRPRKN